MGSAKQAGKLATRRKALSYRGLSPASSRSSAAARSSSKKAGTACECLLRKALFRRGLRFRKNFKALPGCPDIVFVRRKVLVFCDGDFWHGKDWPARKRKLALGNNANYWVAKIERNMQRDRENDLALQAMGWRVIRVWESHIKIELEAVCERILGVLKTSVRETNLLHRAPKKRGNA